MVYSVLPEGKAKAIAASFINLAKDAIADYYRNSAKNANRAIEWVSSEVPRIEDVDMDEKEMESENEVNSEEETSDSENSESSSVSGER